MKTTFNLVLCFLLNDGISGNVIRSITTSSSESDRDRQFETQRNELCMEHCKSVKNCYIQISMFNETESILSPVCLKDYNTKRGSFHVEHITPIPEILLQDSLSNLDSSSPNLLCSIRCPEGKTCEIVDLPCYEDDDGENCPQIDVCVDENLEFSGRMEE